MVVVPGQWWPAGLVALLAWARRRGGDVAASPDVGVARRSQAPGSHLT